jgi:hypothetical protein
MPTDDDRMEMEGTPSKPYKLYRTRPNGEIISLVAEADTRDELGKLHERRLAWHYKTDHNRKPID